MKNFAALILFFVLLPNSYAQQDIKVKKGIIYVGDVAYAQIQADGCGIASDWCVFYIRNLQGENLILVSGASLSHIKPHEKSPETYLRYTFPDIDGVAETANPSPMLPRAKDVAKVLVNADLIKDNQLNVKAAKSFIQLYGTRYSDKEKNTKHDIINLRDGVKQVEKSFLESGF